MDRLETDFIRQIWYNVRNLYSSMDRLETGVRNYVVAINERFIFQYGQIRNYTILKTQHRRRCIYIPVWIDQKHEALCDILNNDEIYIPVWIDQKLIFSQYLISKKNNLYSSMDRLETYTASGANTFVDKFIFQYGQIRNIYKPISSTKIIQIYIPVWIDQKRARKIFNKTFTPTFIFQYGQIRNSLVKTYLLFKMSHLYSSMDRLETKTKFTEQHRMKIFIFQYGQIRNPKNSGRSKRASEFIFQYGQIRNGCKCFLRRFKKSIYIPVWIDQKPITHRAKEYELVNLYSSMDRLETSKTTN